MFENPLDEANPEIGSGQTSGSKPKSEPEKFVYSIRNRPKKEAKAKMSTMEQFAADIDKPKGPKETW